MKRYLGSTCHYRMISLRGVYNYISIYSCLQRPERIDTVFVLLRQFLSKASKGCYNFSTLNPLKWRKKNSEIKRTIIQANYYLGGT